MQLGEFMTPLEKIEKLLINPDFPTQELIDYKIDLIVNSMIDKCITGDNNNPSSPAMSNYKDELIDITKNLEMGNNKLQFYARKKDFDRLFEKVQESLLRYDPYVGIAKGSNPLSQKDDCKSDDEDSMQSFGFCLKLSITVQMKNSFLLKKNIEQQLEGVENKQNINKVKI